MFGDKLGKYGRELSRDRSGLTLTLVAFWLLIVPAILGLLISRVPLLCGDSVSQT